MCLGVSEHLEKVFLYPHSTHTQINRNGSLTGFPLGVLGCGWGAYPHTSRGGRIVVALRSVVPLRRCVPTLVRKVVIR